MDGIFTDGHPPQIIDGLKQTNIDIAGGNLQPARPLKVIIFNKLVVRSQDLSVSDISLFLDSTFHLPVFSAMAIKIIAMAITIQN